MCLLCHHVCGYQCQRSLRTKDQEELPRSGSTAGEHEAGKSLGSMCGGWRRHPLPHCHTWHWEPDVSECVKDRGMDLICVPPNPAPRRAQGSWSEGRLRNMSAGIWFHSSRSQASLGCLCVCLWLGLASDLPTYFLQLLLITLPRWALPAGPTTPWVLMILLLLSGALFMTASMSVIVGVLHWPLGPIVCVASS